VRTLKKRVLIVDDEAVFARMVKLNLEATGHYEVRTEEKGALAVKAAREFKPDLILLDLIMPDMEGSMVAHYLKSDSELKHVPIVFLTAAITQEEIGPNGGVINGESFLAKPVTTKQLSHCIAHYLSE
jgi:CheY-like chemotaxis protein